MNGTFPYCAITKWAIHFTTAQRNSNVNVQYFKLVYSSQGIKSSK